MNMKCILIKAGGKAEVVEVKGKTLGYEKMKELLEIDSPVTVVERKVGETYYDLWVDDEGLLKEGEPRYITGYLTGPDRATEALVGNLLITHHDEEGATTGLSDEEIATIMNSPNMVDYGEMRKWQGLNPDEDRQLVYGEFGIITVKAHCNFLTYTL